MDEHDATEQAYKNGYEKGKQDTMRWIPVTERLPERGQIVLVCGSRKGIYTAEFRIDGKYPYFHKLNSKTHWCEPTHWMPLPDAPKGE